MTEEARFVITEEEMTGIINYLKNSNLHVQAMPINMVFDKVRTRPLEERKQIFKILKILCSCDEVGIGKRIYDAMVERFPEEQP